MLVVRTSWSQDSPPAAAVSVDERAERELEHEARLATIQALALARNPELVELTERTKGAREQARAMGRLPDPEFEYQLWAMPLARPYALDQAEMHMFGLRQSLPPPGSLDAREHAAVGQANILIESRRARELDLLWRVRKAYAQYYRSDREYRIHLEHVALSQQVLDVTRAAYQAGRSSQEDVLRTRLALSRLHQDIARIESDRNSARALLNTLMARPIAGALGPPASIERENFELRVSDLQRLLNAQRPELAANKAAIAVREHQLELARANAHWPSFMLGVQYMYMPTSEEPSNYGVTFSMSLPWLNPRYGDEIRSAQATLAAEHSALASAHSAAAFELYDAVQRLEATRANLDIIERDLLPVAQQSFEAAQASYRGGQGDARGLLDAITSLLDTRIERERALAEADSALSDLERAVGAPLTRAHGKDSP
jgi:outer membrane protein, heavy metal efflux system